LSTDTDLAVELCRRLAQSRSDVLIGPPLPYGSSGEHAGFKGTLSIGQAALEFVLLELGRSAGDTFGRVLFVNGHGGNAETLVRAVNVLRAEGRDIRWFAPSWSGDPHAGRPETSMLLAIRPDLVSLDRAVPGDPRSLDELLPELRAGGVAAITETGVLGDPTGADAAEGEQLLLKISQSLQRFLEEWLA
jgi:creatinine amidohydrolase